MHKSDAVPQQSSKRHRLQCSMFRTVYSHKVIAVGFNTLYYNAAGEITIRTNKKKAEREAEELTPSRSDQV